MTKEIKILLEEIKNEITIHGDYTKILNTSIENKSEYLLERTHKRKEVLFNLKRSAELLLKPLLKNGILYLKHNNMKIIYNHSFSIYETILSLPLITEHYTTEKKYTDTDNREFNGLEIYYLPDGKLTEKEIINFSTDIDKLDRFLSSVNNKDAKKLNKENKDTGKKEAENLWLKTDEEKHKIYTALNKENILKYSGKGKPTGYIKDVLYVFKALHNTGCIKKHLIEPVSTENNKKEKWFYSFISNEFIRDIKRAVEKDFDNTNLAQAKEDQFEDKTPDQEYIKKIESIINSALIA